MQKIDDAYFLTFAVIPWEAFGGIFAVGSAVVYGFCRVFFPKQFKKFEDSLKSQEQQVQASVDLWEIRFKASEESYAKQFGYWNQRLEQCESKEEELRSRLDNTRKELDAAKEEIDAYFERERVLTRKIEACRDREQVLTRALAEANEKIKLLEGKLDISNNT